MTPVLFIVVIWKDIKNSLSPSPNNHKVIEITRRFRRKRFHQAHTINILQHSYRRQPDTAGGKFRSMGHAIFAYPLCERIFTTPTTPPPSLTHRWAALVVNLLILKKKTDIGHHCTGLASVATGESSWAGQLAKGGGVQTEEDEPAIILIERNYDTGESERALPVGTTPRRG